MNLLYLYIFLLYSQKVYSYNNFNKIGFKLHFEFLINYLNKIIHTYLHFKLSIIMFIFYI